MRRKHVVALAGVAIAMLVVITVYFRVFHWQEHSGEAGVAFTTLRRGAIVALHG
jgi:hypothetical protein